MIKLTERREITPYKWVHPDEDRTETPAESEEPVMQHGHSDVSAIVPRALVADSHDVAIGF
jgi:hypothetical protein